MKCYGSLFDKLITEAPVTDIGTYGNFDKSGGFTKKADKALVASPVRLQAIKSAFEKSNHDFRLYFAQFPGGGKWLEHGIPTPQELEAIEQKLKTKLPVGDIDLSNDATTVIFTNNRGDQWRPMTPWIIAHRIGHAIMSAARKNMTVDTAFKQFREAVEGYLDRIADEHNITHHSFAPRARRDEYQHDSYGYARQAAQNRAKDNRRRAVAHAVGAMRSARENNLRNTLEFVLDTLAQYLITGRVYLAAEHRLLITGHAWGKPQGRTLNSPEMEMIKRDFEMEMPGLVDNLLHSVKGRTLVM